MKVLFATVEMSPLAKVGGLADVAGSLPRELVRAGHDARVVMPLHRGIDLARCDAQEVGAGVTVQTAAGEVHGFVRTATVGGVPVYLIDLPAMFDRGRVYGEPDDADRWLAFCDAVVAWLDRSGWQPDLLHLNEWHTAFIASRLRQRPDSRAARLARVYTIHNLAIHGGFDDGFATRAGFDGRVLDSPLAWEPWVSRSGMGQGLLWCDAINTVSPTYAREIMTPEYGAGLDRLLRSRKDDLRGILNGIDVEAFDPGADPHLVAPYDATNFTGHARNKAALQHRVGLDRRPEAPLIGMVTRLFYQKGVDLAAEAFDQVAGRREAQLVVLGTGDQQYHEQLTALVERHRGKAAVVLGFDADLAQLIYGGTDLFLMPSRFEPCGLGQMIALRYGSVPVVRRTGGLEDTVREWSADAGSGNGFLFDRADAADLAVALDRALDTFTRSDEWRRLVQRAMSDDNSWTAAGRDYVQLYRRAVQVATGQASAARR